MTNEVRYRQFLDCPFCGRSELQIVTDGPDMAVRCCTCGAVGPRSASLHGAVQWWNTRKEPDTWDS